VDKLQEVPGKNGIAFIEDYKECYFKNIFDGPREFAANNDSGY
jgi:hypothetical protein